MNVLKNKIKRRSFIRSLSSAGLILPFASQFMLMNKAHAAPGGARRFVQVFYSNGCDIDRWHSYSTGGLDANSFNENDCPLRPLAPHVDNLLAIKKLSYGNGQGAGQDHPGPAGSVMSGGKSGQETIEHLIGRNQGGLVKKPLYVGVRAGGITVFRDQYGNNISPESNPQTVYRSNFKSISGGSTGEPSAETKLRKNILESLEENLDLLRLNKLSEKESAKLSTYDDSLAYYRDILESDIKGGGFVEPTIGIGDDNGIDPELEAHAQIDNVAMAFASDFTRTAGIQFISPNGDPVLQNFPSLNDWLGIYGRGKERSNWNENKSHASSHLAGQNSATGKICNAQTAWYNMMVARLVSKLKDIQDPTYDGSVFDNTVIMVMSEHAFAGQHGDDNAGIYVMAGANTGIRTGVAIDAGGRGPADLQYELAKKFNVNISSFGNSGGSRGIDGFNT